MGRFHPFFGLREADPALLEFPLSTSSILPLRGLFSLIWRLHGGLILEVLLRPCTWALASLTEPRRLRPGFLRLLFSRVSRRHRVPAEGLPGLHPLAAAERGPAGPGGEGAHHPGGPARLPGSLQHLRLLLPEPRPLRGARQRLPLRLRALGARRRLLPHRYSELFRAFRVSTLLVLFLSLRPSLRIQANGFDPS